MRLMKCINLKKVLVRLLLLVFVFQLFVCASTGLTVEAQNKQFRIILTDGPDSPLEKFVRDKFPEAEIVYQLDKELLDVKQSPSLILMPEHQAYPLLEQGIGSGFLPLFRASLIDAVLDGEGGLAGYPDEPMTWLDLSAPEQNDQLATIVPQVYLVAALEERLSQDQAGLVLENLGKLYSEGRFQPFNTSDVGDYKVYSDIFESDKLPGRLIAWDYYIAHINQELEARSKSHRYRLQVPKEGSMFVDYGFFASDRNAFNILEQRLGSKTDIGYRDQLLSLGYRLPDGSANSAYYLNQDEYYRVSRIKNYYTFNEEEMGRIARYKRSVLGYSRFLPASTEGEFISYLLLSIAFVIWIAFIFYRLDEPIIRLPLSLYILALAIWIFVRISELLGPRGASIDSWYTYGPIFLVAGAWLFLAWRQALRRQVVDRKKTKLFHGLVILLIFGLVVAITNSCHHLVFESVKGSSELESYGLSFVRIYSPGPFFYILALILFLAFMTGYYLLYVAREQELTKLTRLLAPALICFAFIYNGYSLRSNPSLDVGAFTRNNAFLAALLMELILGLKILPANTKYFRFFRYNPLSMRLISNNLEDVYAPDSLPDLTKSEKAFIRKIIRTELKPEKESKSRFTLKRKIQPQRISDKVVRVELDNEFKLMAIKQIYGGYLVWVEDIEDLHILRSRLVDLSDRLEQQQLILKQEQNIKTQLASQKIRRALFGALEQQLSDNMKEISSLIGVLKKLEKDADKIEIKRSLAQLRMLVSQAKRKSNLLVRQEPKLELEELRLIFREALQDAESAGITGIVVVQGKGSIKTDKAIFFYDYLQEILQKNADLPRLSVFLLLAKTETKTQMRLILNADQLLHAERYTIKPELQARMEELGAKVEIFSEDQDLRLQVELEEGENA